MGECEPDEIDDWHRDNEAGRKFKSGGGSGSGSDHGSGDGGVWWEFQGPGAWERYDDSVALLIETAFAAADGSPVTSPTSGATTPSTGTAWSKSTSKPRSAG